MNNIDYLDDAGTEYLIQKLLARIHNGNLTLRTNTSHVLGSFSANQRDDVDINLGITLKGYGLERYGECPYGNPQLNNCCGFGIGTHVLGYGFKAFGIDNFGE